MEFSHLVNSANVAVKNNKIHEAIKLLEDAFKINSNSFDVCFKLGLLTFKLDDLNNSIKYFKKTLLLNPNSSLGYSNLGLIYSRQNKNELALKNYLRAIDLEPNNFTINYNLANLFFSINNEKNAEFYFKKSIEIQPQNFYPYNNLFQLYDRTNNLVKLEEVLIKIIKLFGKSPQVQFLEGIFNFRKKKYKETIEIFQNLNFDGKDLQKNILINNTLAKCHDQLNNYKDAYQYYLKSNKILEDTYKNKFDKNKFNNRILKRLNSFSNVQEKFLNSEKTYDDNVDPIFLIGFPRSGTTLLDTILRTHKSIEVIEESSLIDHVMNKLNYYIKDDILNLNFIDQDTIKELRDLYFKERKDLIGYKENIIYVDKKPLNIIYVAEINKIFPKAKFILALRNPYDAVLSCFMQPFIPNDAMSNFYNLKNSSDFYDLVMRLWEIYEENLNLNMNIIKYEDVVNNFDNCIKKLLNFLEVDWNDDLRNFYLTASKRGIINTPSYNQVNKPLYKGSIDRWKNYLNKFDDYNLSLDKWTKKYKY